MYEQREWGEYRVFDYQTFSDGSKSLTKELTILPGKNISYQKHHHRNESWTFVSGTGLLLIDGVVREVKAGDHVFIQKEQLHAIKAIDKLHIIEVQLGDELIEEDVERFEWDWSLF
jgi:mannose-1-phosphate guanylyltransferase